MGFDKRTELVGGLTMLGRAVAVLESWCCEVLVADGRKEDFMFAHPRAHLVHDRLDGGPVGGLEAGLAAMRSDRGVVVACDMPLLDGDLLRYLASLCDSYEAVVPIWDSQPQPLHAVYAASCLPVVQRLLNRDIVPALSDLLGELHVRFVTADELRLFNAPASSFTNINTAAELRSARARSYE